MTQLTLNVFLLLMFVVQFTEQTIYTCDTTASCGCSSSSVSVTRIVGGETANTTAWAWAVSLEIDEAYLCGGSIISPTWILTAAHCLTRMSETTIVVYAGSNNRWSGSQTRTTIRNIPHPQYNSETFTDDIALLELNEPLNLTVLNVKTVCLPSLNGTNLTTEQWPAINSSVVAVGWGRLIEGGSTSSNLQQVTMIAMDYNSSMCSELVLNNIEQICAGVSGGGKDTCQGDSGGPLMVYIDKKQWVLAGITSSGIGCARPDHAGIYTRVAAYETWIKTYVTDAHWVQVKSNAQGLFGCVYGAVMLIVFVVYLTEFV